MSTLIDELLMVLKQIIEDQPQATVLAKKASAFLQDVFLERLRVLLQVLTPRQPQASHRVPQSEAGQQQQQQQQQQHNNNNNNNNINNNNNRQLRRPAAR